MNREKNLQCCLRTRFQHSPFVAWIEREVWRTVIFVRGARQSAYRAGMENTRRSHLSRACREHTRITLVPRVSRTRKNHSVFRSERNRSLNSPSHVFKLFFLPTPKIFPHLFLPPLTHFPVLTISWAIPPVSLNRSSRLSPALYRPFNYMMLKSNGITPTKGYKQSEIRFQSRLTSLADVIIRYKRMYFCRWPEQHKSKLYLLLPDRCVHKMSEYTVLSLHPKLLLSCH